MSSAGTHRFFMDSSYTGEQGLRAIPGPPWTPKLPAEFRYTYDVLEQALPSVAAQGLTFHFTKEAAFLPSYGRDVVAVLLQEERCKVPVYGRHVRAVLRNLLSAPALGFDPAKALTGFTRLEAILAFEYVRDWYTHVRSRLALRAPRNLPSPVRREARILRLPLGYHSQEELPQIPMGDRSLDLFFAGEVNYKAPPGSYLRYTSTSKREARVQLWAELQRLQATGEWKLDLGNISAGEKNAVPHFGSYSEKMMQSRICVAPRGSVADSFRSFEGLRAGCLVVCNRLPADEFMYPHAPLLIVHHWREIEGILKKYARDIAALEAWRARALAWWHDRLRPEAVAPWVAERLNEAGASLL